MKYNREWLDGINETWSLIRNAPLDQVPFHHRALIKQQFDCRVNEFKYKLNEGLSTHDVQQEITDLTCLAFDLIEEDEKKQAVMQETFGQ